MLDSSAKLPSGILNGNINQFGDFDQCLNIEVDLRSQSYPEMEDHQFNGKYCLAYLDIDLRNSTKEALRNLDNSIFSYRHISGTVHDVSKFKSSFSHILMVNYIMEM